MYKLYSLAHSSAHLDELNSLHLGMKWSFASVFFASSSRFLNLIFGKERHGLGSRVRFVHPTHSKGLSLPEHLSGLTGHHLCQNCSGDSVGLRCFQSMASLAVSTCVASLNLGHAMLSYLEPFCDSSGCLLLHSRMRLIFSLLSTLCF